MKNKKTSLQNFFLKHKENKQLFNNLINFYTNLVICKKKKT
jgi:hypothetical protein